MAFVQQEKQHGSEGQQGALFNARPNDTGKFDGDLDAGLWNALASATSFPAQDLFLTF